METVLPLAALFVLSPVPLSQGRGWVAGRLRVRGAVKDEKIQDLIPVYRDGLLEDVIPFWMRHAVDREHGGFISSLGRDGTVLDTDKAMWVQARFTWLLATLYAEVEPRPEWLDLSRHGIEFMRRHGFDDDGRMWFHVTRDGRPIRKRRYVFTECFAAMANAAYAKVSGEQQAAEDAASLLETALRHLRRPGLMSPKHVPGTRETKSIGLPMILMNVGQVLRRTIEYPGAEELISECMDELRRDFVKPDERAVMENVGPGGELLDHFDGRILNPGHAMEAAWFVLDEARMRGDGALTSLGCSMLDWMWERGWDEEHGGIFYFRDVRGLPVQEYWHDMKFWWPQNEAVIATLLAHELTGEERYADMHAQIHEWAHRHFPDAEHGEWYGYLHRDGSVSVPLKGNMWKGPFHIPRMQLTCWQILERMKAR